MQSDHEHYHEAGGGAAAIGAFGVALAEHPQPVPAAGVGGEVLGVGPGDLGGAQNGSPG
jgi:hypothetical protein